MNVKRYFLHCYNHHLIDAVRDIFNVADLAHKNDQVEISIYPESADLENFPEKGTKIIDALKDICQKNNWPLSKFKIITANPLQKEVWPFTEFRSSWPAFLSLTDYEIKDISISDQCKKFGCYVCNSSWPRLWISSYLFNTHVNDTDQTFLRSPSTPAHAINFDLDSLVFNFSSQKMIADLKLDEIANFISNCPITHPKDVRDIEEPHPSSVDQKKEAITGNIMSFYDEIFVDLVCESYFSGKVFYLTEKTARPLIAGRPFLIIGPVNFLSNLRKLGFRTFNKYWSEDYDWLSGPARLVAISKIVDQIAKWSDQELMKVFEDMKPDLCHNQLIYKNLTSDKINAVFNS